MDEQAQAECLDEISTSLSGQEILPHLMKYRVLVPSDGEFLLSDSVPKKEKTKRLLSLLNKNPSGFHLLSQCLQDENQHLGHSYLAALLGGSKFASDDVLCVSFRVKERMVEMADSMMDVDIDAITPFLIREGLLTESEIYLLRSVQESPTRKISKLLMWLDAKGPTAHYLFARCLRDEATHLTHRELFDKITIGLSSQIFDRPVSVTRNLPQLAVHACIKTTSYFKIMQKLRRLHLEGKWDEAYLLVDKYIASKAQYSVDYRTAILLESCNGWITRRQADKVLSGVEEAREMCKEIVSNNSAALEGRCEWVLAKFNRYMNNNEKALEHIQNALAFQFHLEMCEDKAITLYCYGCIQLAFLAEKPDVKTAKKARTALENVLDMIADPRLKNFNCGLDFTNPIRIRLAQAYLGSSPFQPGRMFDSESIASAKTTLAAVDFGALAPRSKCTFLLTESDIYRNEGNTESAVQSAESALHIANENRFEVEIISAENRIRSLHVLTCCDFHVCPRPGLVCVSFFLLFCFLLIVIFSSL